MSQPKRLGALSKFSAQQVNIIVATDVASRGLDIPHVDCVVNYVRQLRHYFGPFSRCFQLNPPPPRAPTSCDVLEPCTRPRHRPYLLDADWCLQSDVMIQKKLTISIHVFRTSPCTARTISTASGGPHGRGGASYCAVAVLWLCCGCDCGRPKRGGALLAFA